MGFLLRKRSIIEKANRRYAGRSAMGFFIEEADILWEKQTADMPEGAPWDFLLRKPIYYRKSKQQLR